MNPTEPEALPIEIDVHAVQTCLESADPDFVLLDCREADEHALVHIPSAVLIPMSEIQARLAEVEAQREKHLVIHCHHGGRSLQVTHWLRQQGFPRVQNMTGGIDRWATEIDPSLPRY